MVVIKIRMGTRMWRTGRVGTGSSPGGKTLSSFEKIHMNYCCRYSTGWRCGLHADWTELTGCVDNYLSGLEPEVRERRYFYITFLRFKELVLLDKILSLTLSGTRCRGT